MTDGPNYWFPAKRYGWGWGLPSVWQGWLVLALFVVGIVLVALVVPPSRGKLAFFACNGALTAMLVACCWLKGEPPKWRWGDR